MLEKYANNIRAIRCYPDLYLKALNAWGPLALARYISYTRQRLVKETFLFLPLGAILDYTN